MPIPLGLDPGCGGAFFPQDPGDPTGPGIATGLDPDTIDPGWQGEDSEPPPVPEEDEEDDPPIDSQWQNTRYVTLANACDGKAKVSLTYETLNEDNEWVQDSVDLELDSGEVCNVVIDGWRVNARRIKISGTCGDNELTKFKDRWLNLVPETDQDGVQGYPSPDIQRAVITLR